MRLRFDVVAVPDSNWGVSWESLAGTPATLQHDALATLVRAVLVLAAANVGIAGLALGLHSLQWIATRRRWLAIRSALGAGLRHQFSFVGKHLLPRCLGGCVAGLLVGAGAIAILYTTWPAVLTRPALGTAPAFAGLAAGGLMTAGLGAALLLLVWVSARRTERGGRLGSDGSAAPGGLLVQSTGAALQIGGVLVVAAGSFLLVGRQLARTAAPVALALPEATVTTLRWTGWQTASLASRSAGYGMLMALMRDSMAGSGVMASPGAWLGLGKTLSVGSFCGDCHVGVFFTPTSSDSARIIAVSPGSLTAMSGRLLAGRELLLRDSAQAPRTAVLSDLAARQLFPGSTPLGKTVRLGSGPETDYLVVGVVRPPFAPGLGSTGDTLPIVYVSLLQHASDVAEVTVPAGGGIGRLRATVAELRGGPIPWPRLGVSRTLAADARAFREPVLWLTEMCIGLGGLAAMLGAYAIAAFMRQVVRFREHEIAIRLAIGASPARVVVWVSKRAVRITIMGLMLGATGARWLEETLRAHLEAVGPGDLSFLVTLIVPFIVLGLLATWVPARAASRTDPAVVWREAQV